MQFFKYIRAISAIHSQAVQLIYLQSASWKSRADYTGEREHSPHLTNIIVFPAVPGHPAIYWVHAPRL